jgi:2-amino-4-hydroxy-6-hydroxymethyldihydropteridine diphosphokinase
MVAGRSCVAFVALGSNIESPREQVLSAMDEIDALPGTRVLCRSSLYRTAPVGNPNQPDFINAVVQIETQLNPEELLQALLAIERRHGRERGEPNAPRTLDLDVLLYGDRKVATPALHLPHPRMHERAFVLQPLAEIAPDLEVPGHGSVRSLLPAVASQRLQRMDG